MLFFPPSEIETVKSVEREHKERKRREKTAIVGDVHPLINALPSLEEILASSRQKEPTTAVKKRSTKKQKQATKDM